MWISCIASQAIDIFLKDFPCQILCKNIYEWMDYHRVNLWMQKRLDPSVFKIGSSQAGKNKWVEMGKQISRKVSNCAVDGFSGFVSSVQKLSSLLI